MPSSRILLHAKDGGPLAATMRALLVSAGYVIVEDAPDVVITDDVTVVEKIRARDPVVPILVVTAGDDVLARVAALRKGADDALSAPFHASQMMARVDALGRRAALVPRAKETLVVDGCTLDLAALRASRGGDLDVVELTPREAAILRFLALHEDRAVTRAELLVQVWGASAEMETRTVDMTIARLRKKIERDAAAPRIVVSAKGTGYRLGAR